MILRPSSSTLFPYTTLFRSYLTQRMEGTAVFECFVRKLPPRRGFLVAAGLEQALSYLETRSEEHTSELQSLTNLVCRLLLEKKNIYINAPQTPTNTASHYVP